MNHILNKPKRSTLTEYDAKIVAAMYSLIYGFHLPAERIFVIDSYDKKQLYLYGYCKQPFQDMKLKNFEVRTSGIVYCHPTIYSMDVDGGKKTYSADYHDAIIPFHEFVGQNERVFELINELAQENIRNRPILVDYGTAMRASTDGMPFALLEDWEEANRLIGGGSIDVKNITVDYLVSKVCEYSQLYPGKIMTSFYAGKRRHISIERLISEYYEHLLGKHRLELRPHLLDWLKEKMEDHLDSCQYAMPYAEEDDKESIKSIHETFLKNRKDPDNKGTAKLLAEDIAAAKYILKKIDRSFTIPEQNPVAIRDAWKVVILDDFHLWWLKDLLLCEKEDKLDILRWISSKRDKQEEIEIKCDACMMDRLLEIIDGLGLGSQSVLTPSTH